MNRYRVRGRVRGKDVKIIRGYDSMWKLGAYIKAKRHMRKISGVELVVPELYAELGRDLSTSGRSQGEDTQSLKETVSGVLE